MRTSRLEAFSDGVLAIIITVMVLELRQPAGSDLAALWRTTGTGMLSYLLSFVYVGIYWTNHHHMFQLTERVTGGILWANLALLFFLSLFPFTTQWVDTTGYARTPVIIYGTDFFAAGVAYWILQSVIIRSQGPGSALRTAIGRDLKGKISPVVYIVGCAAAALGGAGAGPFRPGIWIAVACYVAAAALWAIPDRRIESRITVTPAPEPDPAGSPGNRDTALPEPSRLPHLTVTSPAGRVPRGPPAVCGGRLDLLEPAASTRGRPPSRRAYLPFRAGCRRGPCRLLPGSRAWWIARRPVALVTIRHRRLPGLAP